VLILRFDTGICTFVPGEPVDVPEGASPLSASGDGPLVEGELAGLHTGLFLLDTASAYAISIGQPMATGLGLPGPESPAVEVMPAPKGDPLQRLFLLESASVGGAVMPAPLAAVLSGERRASFGAGLFRQCVLTLGLPNRYLSVSAVSPESVTHSGTGCLPTRREEGHWTLSIVKGSPADQAGLRPGDLLLAVQDTPAADMDYETVRHALEPRAGEPATLRVGRGGETLTVSLTARPLFGN
jgi:membrane-associated protease RseP (regulator of RpoE activity)